MIPRRVFAFLFIPALVMPIALAVVVAVARLLGAMGDDTGAWVLDRVALAGGILWAVDLVCLITALGANALLPPPEPPTGEL